MERINASKFKEQCLTLLDKHGKPMARLIPASSDCADLIGIMKGKIRVQSDMLSTELKWDAES
jgi:antitoxin (DNA-binding transcriptional repressor) of toxin-antitoxin stability system